MDRRELMRTYKGMITELPSNGIFVFGSNTQGRHGKGAALVAKNLFGAIYGQAHGPQGQSYAIVTKDLTMNTHPSIDKHYIEASILNLYEYAERNLDKLFYVAYGTGNNLNGYTPEQMAGMFNQKPIPNNIIFEESFAQLFH